MEEESDAHPKPWVFPKLVPCPQFCCRENPNPSCFMYILLLTRYGSGCQNTTEWCPFPV